MLTELIAHEIAARNEADAVAIAEEMFADGDAVRIVQYLELVARDSDPHKLIKALFASVHEAMRLGALAGIEHGIETTHDGYRMVRPLHN
jgi:hypothetical protein